MFGKPKSIPSQAEALPGRAERMPVPEAHFVNRHRLTPPFPEGFAAKPAPYGVGFTGLACSEPRLIELAYAFEQATKRRIPPPSSP